jgi:hypothetical protein
MPGRGRVPKLPGERRGAHLPRLGEWHAGPGVGWQHGPIPEPPEGLLPASREAWTLWMGGWVAAHWTAGDVPMLRVVIRLFDLVERGTASATMRTELRMLLDGYGLTPKGQQDRRWLAPKPAETTGSHGDRDDPYRHLRVVDPST